MKTIAAQIHRLYDILHPEELDMPEPPTPDPELLRRLFRETECMPPSFYCGKPCSGEPCDTCREADRVPQITGVPGNVIHVTDGYPKTKAIQTIHGYTYKHIQVWVCDDCGARENEAHTCTGNDNA